MGWRKLRKSASNQAPIPELEPGRLPTDLERRAVHVRIEGMLEVMGALDVAKPTAGTRWLLEMTYMQGYADGAAVEDTRIAAAIERGEWVRPA